MWNFALQYDIYKYNNYNRRPLETDRLLIGRVKICDWPVLSAM